mmetsp:Transcript_5467/g.8251  ORF Transcript_5467/g.8251 Transcript_5467/m.8251 type:complete len:156 (-) Transcript_5467:254-721(-)|eukprot:CAMPEP_0113937600 /NCGR_PEP_ID=MMETSP1339-20121228/4187_1 /TAXON_ID=94617 /ORGANISM="Fibrocapsa japonica" /LENGTH=155 /DNA_ID=CAMNT_0000940431 /DNA_START=112 /DNA_END=579 /DNA_ORIENTATION=- /assembly_acc=CAM_ASM_000762
MAGKCFKALLFVTLFAAAAAFVPSGARISSKPQIAPGFNTAVGTGSHSRYSTGITFAKASPEPEGESKYWEGEWVCADCGYIYDSDACGGVRFEDQKKGFICPQCSGPRRRFAKKVGDKVGITLDGGDAPILIGSFLGLLITAIIGFWADNDFQF